MLRCLVFHAEQTLSKDEAVTSLDSELVTGRFAGLMNVSLLQPEPKRLKRHQDLSCEEQVRAEIFPGVFRTILVSLRIHICGTNMCLGSDNSVIFGKDYMVSQAL